MQAIHQAVLNRITALANSINAEFAVVIDGSVHGPLADRVATPKVRAKRTVVYNFVRDTGYTDVLETLEPGGIYEHVVEAGAYCKNFTDTLRAWAIKHWGKDTYVLASEACEGGQKTRVQLLRVE